MTIEELHNHNRDKALHDLSFQAVGTTDAVVEMQSWLTKWMGIAYEAGFKAAKEGKI